MSEERERAEHVPEHAGQEVEEPPRGTLVLMLLFLGATVVMWFYIYFMLLGRA